MFTARDTRARSGDDSRVNLLMKKFSISILFILFLSAEAAEVDGKAITCKPVESPDEPSHYEFRDGRIFRWSFAEVASKSRVLTNVDEDAPTYTTSVAAITWSLRDVTYSLDRKTLELTSVLYGQWRVASECKVYGSLSEFMEMLNTLNVEGQRKLDEQIKGNKI